MNRGLLVGLLLLAVAAVAGVLFLPSPGISDGPLGPGPGSPSEQDPGGTGALPVAAGGERTASGPLPQAGPELDPQAVVGQVLDPAGKPLSRARVVFAHRQFGGGEFGWTLQDLLQAGTGADAQGYFRLPIEDGRTSDLTVVAVAPGYVPARASGLTAGERAVIRVGAQLLVPGTVLAPDGKPAAGVPVELFDPAGRIDGLPATATTDPTGRFELRSPGPGVYALRVRSAAGLEYLDKELEVTDPAEPLAIRLQGERSLAITARNPAGEPVAGAQLEVRSSLADRRPLVTQANQDGLIEVHGLHPGKHYLRLAADGFAAVERPIEYLGSTLIEDWTLEAFARVQVTAVNGKQRPMPGLRLHLYADPRDKQKRADAPEAFTDEEGVAVFEQVPPGKYVLSPDPGPGHDPMELFELSGSELIDAQRSALFLELASGSNREERLELRRHGFLNLQLTLHGEPVVGARGSLFQGVGPRRKELPALDLSNLRGRLTFPSVWAGTYQLELQGAPDRLPVRREIEIDRGSSKLQIELPDGSLRGLVVGEDGPLAGATIEAALADAPYRQFLRTSADGRFELRGFEAGTYRIRIAIPGLLPFEQTAFQHDGGALDLGTVELGTACSLFGKVSNLPPAGEGLFAGPMLSVVDARGEAVATRALSGEGGFRIDELPRGSYQVQVFNEGQRLYSERVTLPLPSEGLQIRLP